LTVRRLLSLLFSNQRGGVLPEEIAVPSAFLSICGFRKGVLACGVQ
jgi:hypothetical protein